MVKRGISVEAIDNGEIAESLMNTGLVKHFSLDGFVYEPIEGHVDWLICDMIEKPDRVAKLMLNWLTKRKATSTIFNLKLPMQKRFATVNEQLLMLEAELKGHGVEASISAKHLYHDRDEITVAIVGSMHLMQLSS